MQIVTDKNTCEALIRHQRHSILDSFGYKHILNNHYAPEEYCFFVDDEAVLPLVIKSDMASFYGGTTFNHYNSISTPHLLNAALEWLVKRNCGFRLLSLSSDPLPSLATEFRRFEVPFPVTWHYQDIGNYSQDGLRQLLSKKLRYEVKKKMERLPDYHFMEVDYKTLAPELPDIVEQIKTYFSFRGLSSVWGGREQLFKEILDYFNKNENLVIRKIYKNDVLCGIYIIVYDNNEIIFYVGNSLSSDDGSVTVLLYLDMLERAGEIAREWNIQNLDGLRGAFGYKNRFRFQPVPLYALVNDPSWLVREDPDLPEGEHARLLGRSFGCEVASQLGEPA